MSTQRSRRGELWSRRQGDTRRELVEEAGLTLIDISGGVYKTGGVVKEFAAGRAEEEEGKEKADPSPAVSSSKAEESAAEPLLLPPRANLLGPLARFACEIPPRFLTACVRQASVPAPHIIYKSI